MCDTGKKKNGSSDTGKLRQLKDPNFKESPQILTFLRALVFIIFPEYFNHKSMQLFNISLILPLPCTRKWYFEFLKAAHRYRSIFVNPDTSLQYSLIVPSSTVSVPPFQPHTHKGPQGGLGIGGPRPPCLPASLPHNDSHTFHRATKTEENRSHRTSQLPSFSLRFLQLSLCLLGLVLSPFSSQMTYYSGRGRKWRRDEGQLGLLRLKLCWPIQPVAL